MTYYRYRRRSGPPPLAIGAGVAVAAVMLAGQHAHHGHGGTPSEGDMATTTSASSAVTLGQQMAARRGWTGSQWTCLDDLWTRESGWRWWAQNPASTAYGIPQFLDSTWGLYGTGPKTSSTVAQISDGLKYVRGRYQTPCNAWAHELNAGWY